MFRSRISPRFMLSLTLLVSAWIPPFVQAQANFDKAALAWKLPWDADWVTAVAFVGNNRVAAGNNLGQILVWDLPEKQDAPVPGPVWRLDGHTNTITRLVVTPDGKWLI